MIVAVLERQDIKFQHAITGSDDMERYFILLKTIKGNFATSLLRNEMHYYNRNSFITSLD